MFLAEVVEKVSDTRVPCYRPDSETTSGRMAAVDPVLTMMMTSSWAEDPTDRPNFDNVLRMLRKVNGGK